MSVNAQDLSFGINAGINDNTPRGNVMSHEARYGFNVGVFGELELPKLAPGLYTTAGLSFKQKGFINWGGGRGMLNYLELPIHPGYKFNLGKHTKLLFEVGPYLAYGLGGKSAVGRKMFSDYYFKRFDVGMDAVIGLEFNKHVQLKLSYQHGLRQLQHDKYGDLDYYNRGFNLSIGYKF
jgi:hypothetical protein